MQSALYFCIYNKKVVLLHADLEHYNIIGEV